MNVTASPHPTIPIKQVTLNKKFVPLVVSCAHADIKTQAKLFDDQKIQTFIQETINQFEQIKEKNSALYAIRLKATNQYINEKNRSELLSLNDQTRFHEVEICYNLETEVRLFIEKITSLKLNNIDGLIQQLNSIERYIVSDKIFAFEFYAKGGKKVLIDYIKDCDRASDNKKWTLLYHLYKILVILIKNCTLITWDMPEIDLPVIKLVCDTINDSSKESKKSLIPDQLVLLFLNIIDDILNKSNHTKELMLKEIRFNDIIFIIQRQNIQIKEALLIFLNRCYNKCEYDYKKSLNMILTQPLMGVVLREQSRILIHLNIEHQLTNINTHLNGTDNDISRRRLNSYTYSGSIDRISELFKTNKNGKLVQKLMRSSGVNGADTYKPKKKTVDQIVYDCQNNLKIENNPRATKDDKNVESIFRNIAILQKNILNIEVGERIKTPVESHHINKIKLICNYAFEPTSANGNEKHLSDEEKYTRLGFSNISNPLEDFKAIPPGAMALDFMEYFATKQTLRSIFASFLSERTTKNSDYAFPFAKACIYMIKYLCNLLHIESNDNSNDLEEMTELNNKSALQDGDKQNELIFILLTIYNDGIYEFFAKCLWLFQRLWIEMKAQSLDFERALTAFKDSLYKILSDVSKNMPNDQTVSSTMKRKIADFNLLIETWKYDFIKNIKNRYDKSNLLPIKELEKILTDEVIAMIRPKRLHVLCKGEKFEKLNYKEKKFKHKQKWILSSDLKTFNISDCDNNDREISNDQLEVDRIREVKKEESRKQYFILNIIYKRLDELGEQNVLLANHSEEIIDSWVDGINILINPKPTANITCFVECLTDTQLMDLHTLNYEIPQDLPKVPKLPVDFNFNIVSN